MDQPLNLGLSLGYGWTPEQICHLGREADSHGFHSIWLPELQGVETLSTIGALSQITERIRLGTGVVNVYSRSVAILAMAAATLDILSSGRFILGLGASTRPIVENWHGGRFAHPGIRVEESVKAIKALLGGKTEYEGTEVRIRSFRPTVKPIQRDLPVFVAAVSDGMVRVAARAADGVIFFLRPPEAVKHALSVVKAEASASETPRPLEIACSIVTCPSKDLHAAEARARQTIAHYVAVGAYYRGLLNAFGFSEVEAIASEWSSGQREEAASRVSDRLLEALSLYGPAEECRNGLQRFLDAGVSLPILQVNKVGDLDETLAEVLKIPPA